MLIWTVLCRYSSIDADSNNISLISVLEQIEVSSAANGQVIPLDFEIVTLFQRDDQAKGTLEEYEVVLIDPSGTEQGRSTIRIDLTNHQRARFRSRSQVFRVSGEGIYWFTIQDMEGTSLASVPLQVIFQQSSDDDKQEAE